MTEDLRLAEPSHSLAAAFRSLAKEWKDAGVDKHQSALEDVAAYLADLAAAKQGRDLPPGWVACSTFWLLQGEDRIVGTSRLRHRLTPELEQEGGHIGYDVRPSERRKGYGTALLRLTLRKAWQLGLREVLVTCDSDNTASVRIIETNGGRLLDTTVPDATRKPILRYRIVRAEPNGEQDDHTLATDTTSPCK